MRERRNNQPSAIRGVITVKYTQISKADQSVLPGGVWRTRRCTWERSLAGVALLLAMGQASSALAAIINVGGTCTLERAIASANNDASLHGFCTAGSGADTIVLPANSTQTLTAVDNNHPKYGAAGLPLIRSIITIEGNGSTIRRKNSARNFRIITIAQGGFTLRDTTVTGGVAHASQERYYGDAGGGLFAYAGQVTLINSTISDNRAVSGGGVAIIDSTANAGATLSLVSSTISGNRASGSGGGVFSDDHSDATINESTISHNTAGKDGGGLFNGDASAMTLTDSTVSDNRARNGGGVNNSHVKSLLTLAHALISGNRASNGSEVYRGRQILQSSITASNFNLLGHRGLASAQAFANFTPGATDITATSDGNTPTALSAILISNLAGNGGPTQTHALVAGSPAIDAVNDGTCPPPTKDQRGGRRPWDGNGDGGPACDIGSFERAPPSITCHGLPATIVGTAASEILEGTRGPDIIQGLKGADSIIGLSGDDVICGGKDNDTINGGPGNDLLFGRHGDDRLMGAKGNDQLFGDFEEDRLDGQAGRDQCDGGPPSVGDSAKHCEQVIGVP